MHSWRSVSVRGRYRPDRRTLQLTPSDEQRSASRSVPRETHRRVMQSAQAVCKYRVRGSKTQAVAFLAKWKYLST